jgi:hypothetical protein
MAEVGIVIGYTIEPNRDNLSTALMLQVQISSEVDIQSVEMYNPGGIKFNPPVGSRVLVEKAGEAWKIVSTCDDGIEPEATNLPGEIEVYSSAAGSKMAKQKFTVLGEVEFDAAGKAIITFHPTGEIDMVANLLGQLNIAPNGKINLVANSNAELILWPLGNVELKNTNGFVNVDFTGNVEINGTADFAVAYNDLLSAFNELKADLNTFIGVYNSHNHNDPVSGVTGSPNQGGTISTADMTGAKVNTVKLP